jgi:hypothetical protein
MGLGAESWQSGLNASPSSGSDTQSQSIRSERMEMTTKATIVTLVGETPSFCGSIDVDSG